MENAWITENEKGGGNKWDNGEIHVNVDCGDLWAKMGNVGGWVHAKTKNLASDTS